MSHGLNEPVDHMEVVVDAATENHEFVVDAVTEDHEVGIQAAGAASLVRARWEVLGLHH